jgi:hypothetical protein
MRLFCRFPVDRNHKFTYPNATFLNQDLVSQHLVESFP